MRFQVTPEEVEVFFTQAGTYRFARWGRPIVPVVFGVDDKTLSVVKGAIEAVVALAGHKMAETDPELGANLMVFFLRDWSELTAMPDLDRLIEGLGPLVDRLQAAGANQYRQFRFDEVGAIKACFVFIRMDAEMQKRAAEDIALAQAAQSILIWGGEAFAKRSPLAVASGVTVLRPDVADVIRAAYDPVMPVAASDRSHALRLAARLRGGN
ncbi:MAG: hypothetical protein OEZ19_05005 [Paracoccaceae bacterium]|nr:hypothetical protein [Paracoccaceae bacterium]